MTTNATKRIEIVATEGLTIISALTNEDNTMDKSAAIGIDFIFYPRGRHL